MSFRLHVPKHCFFPPKNRGPYAIPQNKETVHREKLPQAMALIDPRIGEQVSTLISLGVATDAILEALRALLPRSLKAVVHIQSSEPWATELFEATKKQLDTGSNGISLKKVAIVEDIPNNEDVGIVVVVGVTERFGQWYQPPPWFTAKVAVVIPLIVVTGLAKPKQISFTKEGHISTNGIPAIFFHMGAMPPQLSGTYAETNKDSCNSLKVAIEKYSPAPMSSTSISTASSSPLNGLNWLGHPKS